MISLMRTGRFPPGRLKGSVPEGWSLVRHSPARKGSLTLHDTFDLRLYRRGRTVLSGDAEVLDGGRKEVWVLDPSSGADFPESVRRATGVRRLLPVRKAQAESIEFRLVDGDGALLAELRYRVFRTEDRPPLSTLRLIPSARSTGGLEAWVGTLAEAGFEPVEEPVERWLLWDLWRERAPYFSKPIVDLDGALPVAEALVRFFSKLAGTVRLNLPGVVESLDTEFLHDLRVAVRRTRAMLPRARSVFDAARIQRFQNGFQEVQRRTNRARDLDVMLLDLDSFGTLLELAGEEAHMVELARAIQEARLAEQRRLRLHLRSRRFLGLLERWESFLAEGWKETVQLPAGGARLDARFWSWLAEELQRVERRHRRASAAREEAALHRLRIGFKRLRYLLELGEPLIDPVLYGELHAGLKATQDVLGSFNDLVVQGGVLESLREQLDGSATVTLDRLIMALAARRRNMATDCLVESRAYFTGTGWKRWKRLTRRGKEAATGTGA